MGFSVMVVVLLLACACLLFDMRRPDAALVLFMRPTVNVVSVGAYALAATIALGILRLTLWVIRILSVLAVGFALVVAGYTGLLLSSFATAPFWRTPLLAVLFVLSSLSCGLAAVVCSSVVFRSWDAFGVLLEKLLRFDCLAIVLELLVLAAFVAATVHRYPAYGLNLVAGAGAGAWRFWLLLVSGGLVLPLALGVLRNRLVGLHIHPGAVALLVLMGGFALRWCIVTAA